MCSLALQLGHRSRKPGGYMISSGDTPADGLPVFETMEVWHPQGVWHPCPIFSHWHFPSHHAVPSGSFRGALQCYEAGGTTQLLFMFLYYNPLWKTKQPLKICLKTQLLENTPHQHGFHWQGVSEAKRAPWKKGVWEVGEGSSWHSPESGQQAACSLLLFYYSGVSCSLLGMISMLGRAGYCRYLVSISSAWHSWRFWLAFLLGVRVVRPGHQLCNANYCTVMRSIIKAGSRSLF